MEGTKNRILRQTKFDGRDQESNFASNKIRWKGLRIEFASNKVRVHGTDVQVCIRTCNVYPAHNFYVCGS